MLRLKRNDLLDFLFLYSYSLQYYVITLLLSIPLCLGILYVMSNKYRMTLWVNQELVNKLKHVAIDKNSSVSEIVEKLIEQFLKEQKS